MKDPFPRRGEGIITSFSNQNSYIKDEDDEEDIAQLLTIVN